MPSTKQSNLKEPGVFRAYFEELTARLALAESREAERSPGADTAYVEFLWPGRTEVFEEYLVCIELSRTLGTMSVTCALPREVTDDAKQMDLARLGEFASRLMQAPGIRYGFDEESGLFGLRAEVLLAPIARKWRNLNNLLEELFERVDAICGDFAATLGAPAGEVPAIIRNREIREGFERGLGLATLQWRLYPGAHLDTVLQ